MQSRNPIVFVSCSLIVIALLGFASFESSQKTATSTSDTEAISKALSFLTANYNPELGLISETSGSSTYWTYSDNFLASLALSQAGQSNSTLRAIAENITASLANYAIGLLAGGTNQYTALTTGPCQFPTTRDYSFPYRGVTISTTLNNGPGTLSETRYADIAFLKAVCLYHQGDTGRAMLNYTAGRGMFDGRGLHDSVYDQSCQSSTGCQYQTFKLALFIYASAVLRQPIDRTAISILLSMQAQDGGFYTGYDAQSSAGQTMTNTETTSLAILAVLSLHGS